MTTRKHTNGTNGTRPHAPQMLRDARDEGDAEAQNPGRLPDTAYVVLGYVGMHADGAHGYFLGRLLSRPAHRLPSLRLGQLYRILRRLENAGLVESHVEADSSRLRYRFTITARGEHALAQWMSHLPTGTGATCQHLLHRLRFADRLPGTALVRLIDEAARECSREIESLGDRSRARGAEPNPYESAFKARLANDRCWLEEVRRVVARSVSESAKAGAAG